MASREALVSRVKRSEPLTPAVPDVAAPSIVAVTAKSAQDVVRLLDSWCNTSDEEAREQQETFELLSAALDERRHSARKLFP